MAFDPDAFLAKAGPAPAAAPATSSGGFDPDAFLASMPEPAAPAPSPRLTGRFGPGSVAPDEAEPDLHVSTLQGLRAHTTTTPEQRARKLDADSTAAHTDDPGVQAILGGVMGAGAGNVIGTGARALGMARAAPILEASGAGGVANKTQGGDFTAGALLGGATAMLPAGAGVLRDAGESSIARSEARSAASPTPVRDAWRKAGSDVVKHAKETATGAALGEVLGGHGALGHGLAAGSAAMGVGIPVARAAALTADEGAAAVARRLIAKRAAPAVAEEVGPLQAAGWDPEGWKYDQAPATTAVAAPAAPPSDPWLRQAQDALKTAEDPRQAEIIRKAIAGYEEKMARPPRVETPAPAGEQLAPTLAERAAAIKETQPAPASLAHRAESVTREMPAISMDDLVYGKRPVPELPKPAAPAPSEAPKWEPSKYDDKYMRKLKMSADEYRAMMDRWFSNAAQTMQDPHATAAAKARAVQILRGSRTNVPAAGELDAEAAY